MSAETQFASSVPYPENTVPSIRKVNVVPRMAPPHKFLENKKGEVINWDSSNIARKDLLFLRNCSDLVLKISSPFTKLLIESCTNVTIHASEKIMTNMIEIWKSKNVTVHIEHAVYTAQIDMCDDVTLNFAGPKEYQQVVWSNCQRLAVNFRETPEHNTITGLNQMRQIYSDVSDTVDQFFLRFLEGVLTPEVMIRLPGGFPSTTREADQWDAEHPHDIKFF